MNIFDSHIEAAKHLNRTQKKEYYCAVIEFLYYGVEHELKGAAAAVFTAIKPTLELSRARSQAGSLGGKAASKQQANSKQNASKQQATDEAKGQSKSKGKSKGNSNNKERVLKNPKETRFKPPSVEEVAAYCKEKNYTFNAETFIAFYDSNGWKVGKNPMKNWKAACTTWHKRRESEVSGEEATDEEIEQYAAYL